VQENKLFTLLERKQSEIELLKPMELQGWTSLLNGLSSDEVVVIEELPNLKMMWKSSLRQ
jgi:hypothetical protein